MKVKVWNDNVHDLKEVFKGEPICIPAGKYVEMDLYEANDFRGQYHAPTLGANGVQDPASFKMVRIEKDSHTATVDTLPHVCMSCKKKYESEPVLKAHIETEHSEDSRLEIPEVDEEIKKRGRPKKAS